MEIKDKVILITGAGSGLGKALALAAGQAGAKVICAGRRKDRIERTAEDVTKAGGLGTAVEIDVTDDYIVDTGYIVAFEDTLQYRVSVLPGLRGGGFKRLFFSGEGLVCRFAGQGKVWVQTRYVLPYLSWIDRFRPTKSK